jgi:hypothetical protein
VVIGVCFFRNSGQSVAGRHGHAKGIVGLYLDWCCCKHSNELFDDPCIRGSGRGLGHPCCPIHVGNIGKLLPPSFAATILDADVCSNPVLASAYRTLVAIEFQIICRPPFTTSFGTPPTFAWQWFPSCI